MDKYDKFMQEVIQFLNGTRLGNPRLQHILPDRGPIRGSSEYDITSAEIEMEKKLPKALRAWYRVAGAVPPYVYDYDADFSLNDLKEAQKTAHLLTQDINCRWKIDCDIIPFSQRIGEQFLFVNFKNADPDDPPVFHYLEGSELPTEVDLRFTAYIRETWIDWLDMPNKYKGNWTYEAEVLRQTVKETIYQEDLRNKSITGPLALQERWVQEFSASDAGKALINQGGKIPYYWVKPPSWH